jgi:hypothetical protein
MGEWDGHSSVRPMWLTDAMDIPFLRNANSRVIIQFLEVDYQDFNAVPQDYCTRYG